MFGCGRPIAEEAGSSVQFVLILFIVRIAGKSPRLAGTSFTPSSLPAVNESDRDFRLGIVGEKTARDFQFRQGTVKVAFRLDSDKGLVEMSFAQVGLEPQGFDVLQREHDLSVPRLAPESDRAIQG